MLAAATGHLAQVVDTTCSARPSAVLTDPAGLAVAMTLYAVAFLIRARAWTAVLTDLLFGRAWAAIHVALLGNHVAPLRLPANR